MEVEQNVNFSESSGVREEKKQGPLLTGALLVVILLVGAFFLFTYSPAGEPADQEATTQTISQPTGKIYMTLLPKDESQQTLKGIPQAFAYDLESQTYQGVPDGRLFSSQHIFSPNGNHVGFLGLNAENTQDLSDLYSINMNVYRAEVKFGPIVEVKEVSDAPGFAKYTPAVADDGKLLFTLLKEGNKTASDPRFADITTPDVWEIILVDQNGLQRILANGVYPHWATPTQFVFLKNDGLYYYDLDTEEETQLVANTNDTPFSNSSMLDVSDSGELIVWSLPSTGQVLLLETSNWDQAEGPTLYTRNMFVGLFGFWPTISPDGRFFVIETIDPTIQNSLTNPKPKLEFYNTKTFQKLPREVDLDAYDQMEMYVTDWK